MPDRTLGDAVVWRPWGDLYRTVLTGEPAFEHIYGAPLFDYLAGHPDDAAMPEGADAYVMKAVIHDWDDESVV